MIGHRTKNLEPVRNFSKDMETHSQVSRRHLGTVTVPVCQIVGSVGRAHELASDFLPRHWTWGMGRTDGRYRWVKKAMQRAGSFDLDEMHHLMGRYYSHGEYDPRPGTVIPPLDLYKLGDRYYVVDGHHRVAAALSLGQVEMDAMVTEYTPVRYPQETKSPA